MFIRSIGKNNLQGNNQEELVPDIIFNTEEELVDFIKKEKIVKFLKPTHFGLKMSEEIGFLSQKKIKVEDQSFNSDTIFVLDKSCKKIKETHASFAVKLVEESVKERISRIKKENLTNINQTPKNKLVP